jgi:hypothetical protein
MANDDNIAVAAPQPTAVQKETTLRTASQRRVNIIWEVTQACIAVGVVGVTLYANFISATESGSNTSFQPAALTQLDVMAGLVIGFYFGRTNHQRMGGVTMPGDDDTR